jgi:hypothetical protein
MLTCPHCSSDILESPDLAGRQAQCPQCGGLFQYPVPQALVATSRPVRRPSRGLGCGAIFGFAVPAFIVLGCTGILLIGYIGSKDKPSLIRQQRGQVTIVDCPTTDSRTLAVDLATHKQATDTLLAKDAIGYDELVISGKLFRVSGNTRVLVLDIDTYSSFIIVKVRVMDGPNFGKVGWIDQSLLKPTKD